MAQNNLDVGMKCIKYMLLCVTAIFVIVSALIISVGTTIYAIYHDVSFFLYYNFHTPATFIIVIGIMMLFVSLLGCVGALKESTCMVNLFAAILSVVMVLEIAAAITSYAYRAQVSTMLDSKLRSTIPYYYESRDVADAFDYIQSSLRCCGVDSYEDWKMVPSPSKEIGIAITINETSMVVPETCCANIQYILEGNLEKEQCTSIYSNGCLPSIVYLVYQSAGLLGVGAITVAFVQIIGIVFAFSLASSIRKTKSERERRKWEIREQMLNAYSSLNPDEEKKAPVVYVPFYGQNPAA